MIGHLEVTPSRLGTAAENIAAAALAIDEALATLREEATTLAGGWDGDAQAAYATAPARFDADAASRTELLRLMTDSLEALAVAYGDTDLKGARALGATP